GRSSLTASSSSDAVHELRDGRHVGFRDTHGRHTSVPSFSINDGANQFSVLIVQHELRSKKIRSLIAAQIRTVAAATVDAEYSLSAFDHRGITGRALLRGKRLLSSAAPLSLRRCDQGHDHRRKEQGQAGEQSRFWHHENLQREVTTRSTRGAKTTVILL